MNKHTPAVLCFSGHDPSGGAGIQADIETLTHFNCHPCSVLTCLTVQDSCTVHRLIPTNAADITEQTNTLFKDMAIDVIKIGLTGSVECVEAIVELIKQYPSIPIIFDPVLASGDGTSLASRQLVKSIKKQLLPLVTILTPNTLEARQLMGLSPDSSTDLLGQQLLSAGADYVVITGGHENGDYIINTLFHNQQKISQSTWNRLPGEFHGSGCTLATAIAANVALGTPIMEAIQIAQKYTNNALKSAKKLGRGQLFPTRR